MTHSTEGGQGVPPNVTAAADNPILGSCNGVRLMLPNGFKHWVVRAAQNEEFDFWDVATLVLRPT